jgi:hypothetical protein
MHPREKIIPPIIRVNLIDVAMLMNLKVPREQNGNTIITKPNTEKFMKNKYPAHEYLHIKAPETGKQNVKTNTNIINKRAFRLTLSKKLHNFFSCSRQTGIETLSRLLAKRPVLETMISFTSRLFLPHHMHLDIVLAFPLTVIFHLTTITDVNTGGML